MNFHYIFKAQYLFKERSLGPTETHGHWFQHEIVCDGVLKWKGVFEHANDFGTNKALFPTQDSFTPF